MHEALKTIYTDIQIQRNLYEKKILFSLRSSAMVKSRSKEPPINQFARWMGGLCLKQALSKAPEINAKTAEEWGVAQTRTYDDYHEMLHKEKAR